MGTRTVGEGFFADIRGTPQWLTIRGSDRRNPALFIVGGPGVGYAALAPFFAAWERSFTLVQWDQPGAGFTFGKNGDEGPGALTVERLVRDGLRAAELAAARLDAAKLTLLCFSAGTIVGLQMAKRRPELFSAYVGSGQVVDWQRQDQMSYALLLERARHDASMRAELEQIGPPPYADAATDARKSKYAGAPTSAERPAFGELMQLLGAAMQCEPADAPYLAAGVPWPEPMVRALAVYTELREEIVSFDARRLGLRFELPMLFLQGAEDVFTVTAEVQRYASEIQAPRAACVLIDGAGHSVMVLRNELLAALEEHVRPHLSGVASAPP